MDSLIQLLISFFLAEETDQNPGKWPEEIASEKQRMTSDSNLPGDAKQDKSSFQQDRAQ